MHFTQGGATIPPMQTSLFIRFWNRFFGDFVKTVRDDKMSYAVVPAMLLWFLVNRRDIRLDFWTALGPLLFGASFVVAQHAWTAARSVIRDIEDEPAEEEQWAGILDYSGKQATTAVLRKPPRLYRLKLYLVFCVVLSICAGACILSINQYRATARIEEKPKGPSFLVRIPISEGPPTVDRYSYSAFCVHGKDEKRVTLFSRALYVYITNNLSHSVRISAFHVTALTPEGERRGLVYQGGISSDDEVCLVEHISTDLKVLIALPIKVDLLGPRLDSDVGPGETISGWLFLAARKGDVFQSPVEKYEVDLRSIQGDGFQSGELGGSLSSPGDDFLSAKIRSTPPGWEDLGNNAIFYFDDSQRLN